MTPHPWASVGFPKEFPRLLVAGSVVSRRLNGARDKCFAGTGLAAIQIESHFLIVAYSVLRCFRWNGRNGVPQPLAHTAVAPPETPRSPSDRGSEGLRGVSGASRGRVWCRVGGIGSQRLGCLGRQGGSGWVAETRETGKRPGHRLAHDPSGKPSNHFIENSEESLFLHFPLAIQQLSDKDLNVA